MTRFVTGDHHFNHSNIIEYEHRPFDSTSKMNEYMMKQWRKVVSGDDPLLHIGDVSFNSSNDTTEDLLTELPGNPALILGNHDDQISPENFKYLCMERMIVQHHGYRFLCTHRPSTVPSEWTEWVIHGHVHSNEPFIDYNNNCINVSVEQINYTPLPIKILVKGLKNMNSGDRAETIEQSPITEFSWYEDNF